MIAASSLGNDFQPDVISVEQQFIRGLFKFFLKTMLHLLSYELIKSRSMASVSLSPDPFFASLFSFLFVRDTNLAHHIENCSLHSLFVQPQTQTWIKEADEKKCKISVAKKQKRLWPV